MFRQHYASAMTCYCYCYWCTTTQGGRWRYIAQSSDRLVATVVQLMHTTLPTPLPGPRVEEQFFFCILHPELFGWWLQTEPIFNSPGASNRSMSDSFFFLLLLHSIAVCIRILLPVPAQCPIEWHAHGALWGRNLFWLAKTLCALGKLPTLLEMIIPKLWLWLVICVTVHVL